MPRVIPQVLLAVGLAVVAGCGSSSDDEASAPTATNSPTPTAASGLASPLQGAWQTKPVTVEDLVRTLRKNGLDKWVSRFRKNSPVPRTPTRLILEIDESSWNLYGEPRGGERQEIDYDADLEVDGNTATVSHEGDSNTYGWSVRDDTLTLMWQETTYAPYKGIPEEVFQRALYQTASFGRTR